MIKPTRRTALGRISVAIAFAALIATVPAAFGQAKKAPAVKAPAPKPAAVKPSGAAGVHPAGATGAHPGGATTAARGPMANGARANTTPGAAHAANTSFGGRPAARGANERVASNGAAVRTRSDGRVSDLHDSRRGMDVHHNLGGGRRVSVDRPGHGRIYAERGRPGYVQRGYAYHGHDFGRRAYYYHGHEYNRYYRGYGYRGLYLNVYAPGYYYGPGFYGWAYNPWAVPSPTAGVGAPRRGTATMAAISLRIPCTLPPHSG